jgi:DNA-binding CsgD family transcriptional regulator
MLRRPLFGLQKRRRTAGSQQMERQESLADKEPKAGIDHAAREREVLKLVMNGLAGEQGAKKLNVSIRTADGRRAHLLEKRRAANTVELTRLGLYWGYGRLDDFYFYRNEEGRQNAGWKQAGGTQDTPARWNSSPGQAERGEDTGGHRTGCSASAHLIK